MQQLAAHHGGLRAPCQQPRELAEAILQNCPSSFALANDVKVTNAAR